VPAAEGDWVRKYILPVGNRGGIIPILLTMKKVIDIRKYFGFRAIAEKSVLCPPIYAPSTACTNVPFP
jgi:hypothetical protein